MAYRAALERLCRACPYRGFESRPLRFAFGPVDSAEEKLSAIGVCAVRFCAATKES